jgi:hypothetical protein
VRSRFKPILFLKPRAFAARVGALAGICLVVGFAAAAVAQQAIEYRQWRGTAAVTRQPEQVLASTQAEWRSLWSRVGAQPPDHFEPGRMSAVGIFLGQRSGTGYFVNLISTTRRRDRIIVVFEERAPEAVMMAQRAAPPPPPPPRPVASGPGFGGVPSASFMAPGSVAPGTMAPGSAMALSAVPTSRPMGPPTSPWAIVLIPRADLPVTVEQRLFR